jgi:hypothetical protein
VLKACFTEPFLPVPVVRKVKHKKQCDGAEVKKPGKMEKLSYNVYKCTGWISDWTRCGFSKGVDEIDRLDSWKIPSSLKEIDFFENFKFEKHDSALVFSGKKKRKEREPKAGKKEKKPKKRKTDPALKKVVVKGQSGLHPDSGLSETYRIFCL